MKTTVRNARCKIYTFEDMEIYIIDDRETADVYMKRLDDDSNLIYEIGVKSKHIKSLDIERLHEIGYFDDDKEEETK